MGLTADNLLDALAVCSGKRATGTAEIVDLVHQAEPSLAPTLFAAWEAAGAELTPAMRDELEIGRRRVAYYRAVLERLRAKVPELATVKGLEVAGLYPPGFIRNMSDLDLVAPSEQDQWEIARLLMQEEGWDLDSATFMRLNGDLYVMVSMRHPHENPDQPPYGAEITTYYTLGNQGGIPPVLSLPAKWRVPAVKNLLMLLNERYEQRYRARDLTDASLLRAQLSEAEAGTLVRAVVALGLAAEYAELTRLVAAAGLGQLPALPGRQWTVARVWGRRLARNVSFFARPLAGTGRQLQRRFMTGRMGPVDGLAWRAFERCLRTQSAIDAGLLAFGLPLDGLPPQVSTAALHFRGRLGWADTPVARFVLTIGEAVSQSAVDELSGPDHTRPAGPEAVAEAAT
ncbi:MAG TPA: hypothetical protein VNF47_13455 [Streptosporangiaceae bacterium]|nr:hypothetical protein [Streptosporangiaceae bacterium]